MAARINQIQAIVDIAVTSCGARTEWPRYRKIPVLFEKEGKSGSEEAFERRQIRGDERESPAALG
jgi:hypothetical protein